MVRLRSDLISQLSIDRLMDPGAIVAEPAVWAVPAENAKGTKAKGRSGLNCWKPFTPSLNHTRNLASVCWANTAGSIAPMPCLAVLPQRMEYKPPFTETA